MNRSRALRSLVALPVLLGAIAFGRTASAGSTACASDAGVQGQCVAVAPGTCTGGTELGGGPCGCVPPSCVGVTCCIPGDASACLPTTCAQLGYECGIAGDGCGGVLQCGTCSGTDQCELGTCVASDAGPSTDAGQTLCIVTGGSVGTGDCCQSVGDFPDTCLIGACGCPTSGSHSVATCTCPAGECFSAIDGCVSTTTDAGPSNQDAGASLCVGTGGTPGTGDCCESVGDFPDTCLIGACGCPASGSHTVETCTCPSGECYSATDGCVSTATDAGPSNQDASTSLCVQTGGTVGTGDCCQSVGDFPDTCLIGACGCSASGSHTVETCTCPSGECYSASAGCVAPDAGPTNQDAGASLCLQTGGTVGTGDCCESVGDFPDTCLIGACGCSASGSHTVETCTCPSGECYSASVGCVAPDAGHTGNTCEAAGGACVAVVPGSCSHGVVGDANEYSCGTGIGVECCLATTKDAGPTTKDAGPTIYDAATHDAAPSAKDGSAASADGAPDSKLVSAATCAASPLGAGGQGFGWLFGLVAVTLGAVARRRRG